MRAGRREGGGTLVGEGSGGPEAGRGEEDRGGGIGKKRHHQPKIYGATGGAVCKVLCGHTLLLK